MMTHDMILKCQKILFSLWKRMAILTSMPGVFNFSLQGLIVFQLSDVPIKSLNYLLSIQSSIPGSD